MSIMDIIRAWEDPGYRNSLSAEARAALPANPVGEIELTEAELTEIMGAQNSGANTFCGSNGPNCAPQPTPECRGNSDNANTCTCL
jgi:mersacidin/lichenicidin family type 2 lantibiotic